MTSGLIGRASSTVGSGGRKRASPFSPFDNVAVPRRAFQRLLEETNRLFDRPDFLGQERIVAEEAGSGTAQLARSYAEDRLSCSDLRVGGFAVEGADSSSSRRPSSSTG